MPQRLIPQSQTAPPNARVIERYPFIYQATPDSLYNVERLPDPESTSDMALAYRDDPLANPKAVDLAVNELIFWSLASLLLALFVTAIASVIPLGFQLGLAATVSFGLILREVFTRQLSPRRFALVVFGPFAAVIGINVLHYVFMVKIIAAPVLAGIAAWVLWETLSSIPRFVGSWHLAHPRLKPETRANTKIPDKCQWACYGAVGLTVGTALASLMSPALGFLAVIGFGFGLVAITLTRMPKDISYSESLTAVRNLLAVYLLADRRAHNAPGVWRGPVPPRSRMQLALASAVVLSLSLTLSLNCFFPADIPPFVGTFVKAAGDSGGSVNPAFLLQQLDDTRPAQDTEVQTAQMKVELRNLPNAWVKIALAGLITGNAEMCFYLLIALVFAVLVPSFVAYTLLFPIAMQMRKFEEELESTDNDDRTEWQWYVDRINNSPHETTDPFGQTVREANHLFLGIEPSANVPLLLDRRVLDEHAYIVGETGSGKTSLALTPLLIQLLRSQPTDGPPSPVVILDLKGDPALFHTVRQEVEARDVAAGRSTSSFRFFTPEKGKDSHVFNPFNSLQTENRSLMQLCELMLDSLNLNHGEGYGRSYFSRRARMMLFDALRREPKARDFPELFEHLVANTKEEVREAFELVSAIHSLAQYKQLSTLRTVVPPEHQIHMPTVLEEGQVVYFWLPSALESISVREIAKLALYSMLTAAIDRQLAGKPVHQSYLVIDEFQRIAGENFKVVLEQARSFGLSAILANQARKDLETPSADLRTTIQTNTRFKQYFSVSDTDDVNDLVKLSGDEMSLIRSWSEGFNASGATSSSSSAERMKPRVTVNDLLRISDHPLDSLIQISRGSGYTQFGGQAVHLRSVWPISFDTYRKRAAMPWPEMPDDATPSTVEAEEGPIEIDGRSRRVAAEHAKKLMDLFDAKEAELRVESP